ncbi:NUDIX hydrolase [Paramicrobacterium sp. CJ85]|uniref:NUDIX hydrolase n=1 Tax=Paramicrobacterium sp. CJ85 TaxID=3445355 RepID=UPI003F5E1E71
MRNREAARVLLLDSTGRVLLLRGTDPEAPDAGSWWFTPGGGLEAGETAIEAAARELREETGLDATDLAGPVHERVASFRYVGVDYAQHEVFFIAHAEPFTVRDDARTLLEHRVLSDARWWSADELRSTAERVYPEYLADLLDELGSGAGEQREA